MQTYLSLSLSHYIGGYFVFPKAILEHLPSFVGRKQSYEINIPSATSLLSTFERGDLSQRNAVGRLCHCRPPQPSTRNSQRTWRTHTWKVGAIIVTLKIFQKYSTSRRHGNLFLFRAKNINADVRDFHLGFTGKTPTINKQLELYYKTSLRIMAVHKYQSIITTTVTVRNLEIASDKFQVDLICSDY